MEEGEEKLEHVHKGRLLTKRDASKELNRIKKYVREKIKWGEDRKRQAAKMTREEKKKWETQKKEATALKVQNERKRLALKHKEDTDDKLAELSQEQASQGLIPGTDSDVVFSHIGSDQEVETISSTPRTTPAKKGYKKIEESTSPDEVITKHDSSTRKSASKLFMLASPKAVPRRKAIDSDEELVRIIGAINTKLGTMQNCIDNITQTMTNRHDVS